MTPYAYAGIFLATVALAMCVPSWLATRKSNRRYNAATLAFWMSLTAYVDRRAGIDALVESALNEGAALDERAETFDARLLPLSDSEVARRIRKQMDENTAVRELRAEIENWESA